MRVGVIYRDGLGRTARLLWVGGSRDCLGPEAVCFKTYGLGLKKGLLSQGGGEQDQAPEGNWPEVQWPVAGLSRAEPCNRFNGGCL